MKIALAQRGGAVAQAGLWVSLNLLDLGLSITANHAGAVEVGLIARLFGISSWGFIVYKAVMVVAVLAFLTQVRKAYLLPWLNIGMGGICLWNAGVLLSSVLL